MERKRDDGAPVLMEEAPRSAEARKRLKEAILREATSRPHHPSDVADVLLQLAVTFYKAGGVPADRVAHFATVFHGRVDRLPEN